MVRYLAKCNIL